MTSPDLVFERGVAERLLSLARDGAPAEVCGVLGGSGDSVTHVEPVTNVSTTPETRYELDPQATIAAIERVESEREHLGFYHSHPQGPPRPSATDEEEATWEGYVYCIVSLPESVIRAWEWTGDGFEPLKITVEE